MSHLNKRRVNRLRTIRMTPCIASKRKKIMRILSHKDFSRWKEPIKKRNALNHRRITFLSKKIIERKFLVIYWLKKRSIRRYSTLIALTLIMSIMNNKIYWKSLIPLKIGIMRKAKKLRRIRFRSITLFFKN